MATAYGQTGSYFTAMDPPGGRPKDLPLWANAYLGATTSIEPGKAMKDLLNLPASGIENVEISVIQPDKFEAIPREMFAEARRLGKMLVRDFTKEGGASPISLHSPIVEPTGFAENRWDENTWKSNQVQLAGVVEKAAVLGPSVPVTIHGSQVPSMQTRYDPAGAEAIRNEIKARGETSPESKQLIKDFLLKGEIPQMMVAVDPVSGELKPLQAEFRAFTKQFESPQKKLEVYNSSQWLSQQQQLAGYQAEIARIGAMASQATNPAERAELKKAEAVYKDSLRTSAATLLEHAYKADTSIIKRPEVVEALQREDYVGAIMAIPSDNPPKLIRPVEDFAREKAAVTFANAAMRSFDIATNPEKVLGKERAEEIRAAGITGVDKAPIITIENVYPEMAFGRGESMQNLITASRTEFENRLVAERHLSKARAKEVAKNLIGATWDVGHINMLRRFGYNEEKIAEELKKLAPDVKHVHITDNFGSYDAHLAPGMGNVPIKDFLKILEKEGQLGKVRGIVEAGGYVMAYGENPTLHTLKYFNVPAYGFQGAPTWGGEPPVLGGYFMGSSGYSAGYGLMLPPIHYSEYGAGFTGLPAALGAVPGAAGQKSAFAGTPNA
jgi:hypothetical protein